MPEERAPIRIRRARNAVTDPALRQFLTDKTNRNLLSGVTGFKRHLFLFTASVDGVRFFKSSKYHNSVYVFSLFNENIMRRCSQEDLDAFFILITRCDDGSDLLVEEDNRDGTTHSNSLEERDKGETLTDRSENKVQSNRMVKQSLNGLEATTAPIKKTSNPVDLNFRMLFFQRSVRTEQIVTQMLVQRVYYGLKRVHHNHLASAFYQHRNRQPPSQ